MLQLPTYIYILFLFSTLLSLFLFLRAVKHRKQLVWLFFVWMLGHSILSLNGFYLETTVMPPRFLLMIAPPLLFMVVLFNTKKGKELIDGLDVKALTLVHTVRIPVEFTLYALALEKVVPGILTFEGRNFDILAGLTAPIIYYFGFVKNKIGRRGLIAWNVVSLMLLFFIVSSAVQAVPFPFQQIAFDQPNIAVLYFPFVWLPGVIVPLVLFSHLVCLRRLIVISK